MNRKLKNVRVLVCAVALSTLVHTAAQAQDAVPSAATSKPTPTPTAPPRATSTPTATPTPAPKPTLSADTNYGIRRLSLVTEQGSFKNVFSSLTEAWTGAMGNSYNQTLKKGSEIVVMNSRCSEGGVADKITFSLYSLPTEIAPLVKAYVNYVPEAPKASDDLVKRARELELARRARERVLIDQVMKTLSATGFPRKAECDAFPVALALSSNTVVRLEVDDTQCPLIGPKINDGFLSSDLIQSFKSSGKSLLGVNKDFWEKYGYNRFSVAQRALDISVRIPGTKVIVYNGSNYAIYRINYFPDYEASDAAYDVFKTAPIRKGWKIIAVLKGSDKLIVINDPNVK